MIFEATSKISELKKAIEIAFVDDDLLLNTFHIVKSGLKESVNDTKDNILDFKKTYSAEYFILKENEEIIGFCVTSKMYHVLYSFGINKEYRSKPNKQELFNYVVELCQGTFFCSLYNFNTRAINYLTKMGMDIIGQEMAITQLKYKSCQ
jgi:N-acetylglutamate synthase-like GNAT family acetyltransferase